MKCCKLFFIVPLMTLILCSCRKMGPINEARAQGTYVGDHYGKTLEVMVKFKLNGNVVISSSGILNGTLEYEGNKIYSSADNGPLRAVFSPGDRSVVIVYQEKQTGIGLGYANNMYVFNGQKQ